MGSTTPDFMSAVTREHYRRLDAREVSPEVIEARAKVVAENISELDLSDLCCCEVMVSAVKFGDAEIVGKMLIKLVEQFSIRIAKRALDFKVDEIDYAAEEVEAKAFLESLLANRRAA